MKKTIAMFVGSFVAGAAAAGVICSGSGASVGIDTRIGVRIARATEPLAYSTDWNTGTTGVTIAIDGETLFSAAAPVSGDYAWSTEDIPSGLHKLTLDDGVETLSAQFAVRSYSVVYNANGGSGEMPDQTFWLDISEALNTNLFSRMGYSFVGWATEEGGAVVYADGAIVSNLVAEAGSIVDLYAAWSQGTYIVHFDANGGEGSMPDQALWLDIPCMLNSNAFTQTGLAFVGWATDEWGAVAYADGATVLNLAETVDDVVTLYARWADAFVETVDGIAWTYTVSNGEATIGSGSWDAPAVPTSTSGAITIPATLGGHPVTGIGDYAFSDCDGLTSVTIPATVTSLGEYIFGDCGNLTTVIVDGANPVFDSRDNCNAIIRTADNTLVVGCENTTIPNTVTTIGSSAFAGCGLMSITFPPSVTNIMDYAFEWCDLMSVTIPDTVTSIGDGAFFNCSGLESVTIGKGVSHIGEVVFSDCYWLETIVVDGANPVYDSRGNCNAIIRTADNTLVAGCNSSIIPDSVTAIGNSAFFMCDGLLSVTIPDGVTSIGNEAFSYCSGITSMVIPGSVTNIGGGAFRNCTSLTSVSIPDSVTTIEWFTFSGCNQLLYDTSTIPGIRLVDGWVVDNGGTLSGDIDLTGIRGIGAGAFSGCDAIRSVKIPVSCYGIGRLAFDQCDSLEAFVVDELNPVYDSRDNCNAIIRTADNSLVVGCKNSTIPDSVVAIGDCAFLDCAGLASVTIPDGVTSIGDYAFSGCSGLATVTIPESVESIGDGAFEGCTNLTRLLLPRTYYGSIGELGVPASAISRYGYRLVISLDASGGSVSPPQVNIEDEERFGRLPSPSRTGYSFAAWTLDGAAVGEETEISSRTNITLVAAWTANRYAVRFDAGGGAGEMADLALVYDEAAALPASAFVKDNGRFAGWATAPDGAVAYVDGATVSNLTAEANGVATLYAVWEARPWTPADYLDAPRLDFATTGAAWESDWETWHDGFSSFRNGDLAPSEAPGTWTNTTLSSAVLGRGDLSFWWKVNCEEMDEGWGEWYDFATFSADGAEVARVAGDSGWQKVEFSFDGDSWHTLEWTFWRDDYDENGASWENRLWVDGVSWTPAPVTLAFAAGGATAGEVPSPVTKWAGYALALPGPGTLDYPPYVFAGWSDGAATYAAGESFVFGPSNAVLTATWRPRTLAETVDAVGLSFTTGGDADWSVDVENGWADGVSAKSGTVTNGLSSWIETTVTGAGTLTFRWNVMGGIHRNTPFAYAKVEVDGVNVAQSHLTDGWVGQALTIEGAGEHTIRWTYLRTSARPADGDCAWLDAVEWVPAAVEPTVIEVAGVPVDCSWLDRFPTLLSDNGGSYEAAANAIAANGVNTVAECYVAGLVPTNAADVFRAVISWKDGAPVITWEPDLNEGGTKHERVYTVEGRESLTQGSWGPTNANSHFFRVKVELK